MALACCTAGCKLFSSVTVQLTGVYETDEAAQSPEGATVTASRLEDDGSTTPVAGQLGSGTTDEEGVFKFWFFDDIKNLIIEITQGDRKTRCTLLDVQQAEQELSLRAILLGAAAAADSKTRFAVVTPETDIATDLLLLDVQEGTPPDEVNLYDIDELLDAGIAQELRESRSAVRNLILSCIHSARRSSRILLVDILEQGTVSEDTVSGAASKFKAALPQIEQLRKAIRRRIFQLKQAGADPSAIQDLLALERQQILALLDQAGILPQLYLKAALIAENEFERALRAAVLAGKLPPALLYRLAQRALVRQLQETALQTASVLAKLFDYDAQTAVDGALQEALATVAAPAGEDTRDKLRDIIKAFNGQLREALQSAIPDIVATKTQIGIIYLAMLAGQVNLAGDLAAAQNSDDVLAAYAVYYDSFRDTIAEQLALDTAPGDLLLQKKALADLLFALSF